ncbi:MAG: hypothetical protein WCL07_04440 [bacterium]
MTQQTVFSTQDLSTTDKKLVETYLGCVPNYSIDKSLIAGIKIVSKDKQVELSLSNLLDNMGNSLS